MKKRIQKTLFGLDKNDGGGKLYHFLWNYAENRLSIFIIIMKSFGYIVMLLALFVGFRLMAEGDGVRPEGIAMGSGDFAYAIDALQDHFDDEQMTEEDKKVGVPVPGVMLSLLLSGALAKSLLRLKRRAGRELRAMVSNAFAVKVIQVCRNVLNICANYGNDCCLCWQKVELRL